MNSTNDFALLEELVKLAGLTPREHKLLGYILNVSNESHQTDLGHEAYNCSKIAEIMNVSPERIRQLEAKALRKIRKKAEFIMEEDYRRLEERFEQYCSRSKT